MTQKSDLMGVAINAEKANLLGFDVETGVTATGSAQSDAYQLTAEITRIGTAAASTGVKLNNAFKVGKEITVQNLGANAVTLYPPEVSGKDFVLNAESANAGLAIAAGETAKVIRLSDLNWLMAISVAP